MAQYASSELVSLSQTYSSPVNDPFSSQPLFASRVKAPSYRAKAVECLSPTVLVATPKKHPGDDCKESHDEHEEFANPHCGESSAHRRRREKRHHGINPIPGRREAISSIDGKMPNDLPSLQEIVESNVHLDRAQEQRSISLVESPSKCPTIASLVEIGQADGQKKTTTQFNNHIRSLDSHDLEFAFAIQKKESLFSDLSLEKL